MNIDDAKRVLEWSQIREDCPLITIEAFEWAIAEVERLQKANDDLITQGPRVFTSGTPMANLPELRDLRETMGDK